MVQKTRRYASRKKGGRTFEIFSSKGQSEQLAASRVRWDERQRLMATQEEEARRNVQEVDNQNWWTAVYQLIAKEMLKYLEDSEALKLSIRELKEQVLSKKWFQIFSRQGANEILVASAARWEEHLGLRLVLERECLELNEATEHLSEKQEVLPL